MKPWTIIGVQLSNIILEGFWITSFTLLVLNNHPEWAAGAFIAALLGGYTLKWGKDNETK